MRTFRVGDVVRVIGNYASDDYPLHLHDVGEIGTVRRVLNCAGPSVDVRFSTDTTDSFFPDELEAVQR